MKKWTPVSAALLLAISLSAPLVAQDGEDIMNFRAEQLLPADTVLLATSKKLDATRKAWADTSLATVLNMDSFRKLCHDLLAADRRLRKQAADTISGQVALALVPVERDYRWVMLAEVLGEKQPQASSLISQFFAEWEKNSPVSVFAGESEGVPFDDYGCRSSGR